MDGDVSESGGWVDGGTAYGAVVSSSASERCHLRSERSLLAARETGGRGQGLKEHRVLHPQHRLDPCAMPCSSSKRRFRARCTGTPARLVEVSPYVLAL
jgi:hypothetical protein